MSDKKDNKEVKKLSNKEILANLKTKHTEYVNQAEQCKVQALKTLGAIEILEYIIQNGD